MDKCNLPLVSNYNLTTAVVSLRTVHCTLPSDYGDHVITSCTKRLYTHLLYHTVYFTSKKYLILLICTPTGKCDTP